MKALKIDPVTKTVAACDVAEINSLFDINGGGALDANNDILYNLDGAVAAGKFRLGDLLIYGVAYVIGKDGTNVKLELSALKEQVEFSFLEPRHV